MVQEDLSKEVTLRLRQEGSIHEKIIEKNCPAKGNRLSGGNQLYGWKVMIKGKSSRG